MNRKLKILSVLASSFLVVELYYQIAFHWTSVLPSFLRIYDFRYFDSEGTPRFLQNTNAWHKAGQEKEDITIHINSHGFRGSEPLERPSSRIVMVGDSTVFNGGIEIKNTFPFLVQEALRERVGDSQIEVLNLGVGDTNISHYYLKLKNHVLELEPDLVLMFLYLNDSTDSMASSANATSRTATTPWYHSFALENILRLFRNANLLIKAKQSGRFDWVEEFSNRKYLNDHSLWQKMRSDAQYDWGAAWREDSWKAIEIWVSKMLTLTVSTHTDIWFVVLPAAPQVQIGVPSMDLFVPQKSAAAMADRLRIRLLDPLSYLRDNIDKDYLYYDQCHFTALGNKAMSDFLVPRLKEWVNTRAK